MALPLALDDLKTSLKGKCVAVSGSGNVATFCAEKVMELGGVSRARCRVVGGELEAWLLAEVFPEEAASVGYRLTDALREG